MRCNHKVLCSPCNKYMRYVREGNGIESFICDECSQVVKVGSADTKEEFFTSTNTASFQLPLSMESCIDHLHAMWGDIYITAEVRCAVECTHEFIERQLQTLL